MINADFFLRDAIIRHSSRLINKPDVSVVLPTYSRGKSGLLSRAIDSVLAQSYQSFELIVMDDGSTDGTVDIIEDYLKKDDRIIHVRHESNCGLPALRVNEGLLLSRGRYCAYQFDDDRWTPVALNLLVSELDEQREYSVAYGKSEVALSESEKLVLGEQFNYSKLVAGNYIANNSLIHRRSVFEEFGGYDMHLVMRRLCDWDLWLRWGRQVRFLFVDEVVSRVEAAMEGSLGKTVHYDALTARVHMARPRNHLLTPDVIGSYNVDDLSHLQCLGKDKVTEIWRQQVATFQARHREIWTKVTPVRESAPTSVLVTKAHFDTTVDITINNFKEALAGDFSFTFIPQDQVTEIAIRSFDILLLHRTIDFHAQELVKIARRNGKCVVFLMDDDLLTFHELSKEFSYLAPGAPCRGSLEALICEADLVITYSQLMQESVVSLNPRNVRLETNIQERWLANVEVKVAQLSGGKNVSARPSVKIGFAGGGARKEEFAVLWPAIVAASRQLKEQAEFHFWGFTPNDLEQLESPSYCEGFTYSYDEYLGRLTALGFDVMIAPLFAEFKAKRAKCPIKFLECTAAGAIGVFSDVEPYQVVQDGQTGFKCTNTVEAWTDAILKAAKLTVSQRHSMLSVALEQVKQAYTSERQAPWVAATLTAAMLHAKLRRSPESSKPRIAYFCHSPYLGGAENHLLRHALLAQSFQFEPILILPTASMHIQDEMQRRASEAGIRVEYLPLIIETEVNKNRKLDASVIDQISAWLTGNNISLVHSVTLMREAGEAASRTEVAHISSLYATNSIDNADIEHCNAIHSDSLLYANQWAQVLGTPSRCILSYVPEEYFHIGSLLHSSKDRVWQKRAPKIGIFGTVQARKGQKQSIEAIGMLAREHGVDASLDIFGYDHFFPDYLAECRAVAKQYQIENRVRFHGFVQDTASVLSGLDIVLCASDWESLPQVILEGMAARKLVVTPGVGGVSEVVSNKDGIIIRDNSAAEICEGLLRVLNLDEKELANRLDLAQKVVEAECSKHAVANSLFQLYLFAHSRSNSRQSFPQYTAPFTQRETLLANSLEWVRKLLHEFNNK